MKETIVKVTKSKSWFFEKINKIDKCLARLIKNKREKSKINKVRNEKGEVTTHNVEIQRILREYYPFSVCKGFPTFRAHLRMRPVSRGNSRRATWVGPMGGGAWWATLCRITERQT